LSNPIETSLMDYCASLSNKQVAIRKIEQRDYGGQDEKRRV
jgi:hypothetical protein